MSLNSRPRCGLLLLIAALAALPAAAHESGGPVRPVPDALPKGWEALTVQVAQTLAPQLVVENRGAAPLEILDDHGRAFLRIGPAGVQADFATAVWYQTYATAGILVPPAARDPGAPPHWQTVSKSPDWGWFDPRLSTAQIEVPEPVRRLNLRADLGSWSVPVRLGGVAGAIHGHFQYHPAPRGYYAPSLNPPPDFPPDISLRLIPGAPPAVLLEAGGKHTVTVLGLQDEPYLRIGAKGVDANLRSETWRLYGRGNAGALPAAGPAANPQWQHLAAGSRYTWLEPRAAGDAAKAELPQPPDQAWQLPLLVNGRRVVLPGTLRWVAKTGE